MASEPPKPDIEVGRVLGRAFDALTANILPFLAAALLLAGAPIFLGEYLMLTGTAEADADPLSPLVWGSLLFYVFLLILGGALLQGALVRSTILHLSGRPPDLPGSAMLALRLLLPILGISVCVGFMAGIGLVLLIVPGIMIYCAFMVAVPVLVEERCGVFASLHRSRDLTRGSRGRIFLILLLTWVVAMVVSAIVSRIASVPLWTSADQALPNPLIVSASDTVASVLSSLVNAAIVAALYVELREVKEGAGANELANVFA